VQVLFSFKEMNILISFSFSFICIYIYIYVYKIFVITAEGEAVCRVCGWNKWRGNFYVQVLMLVLRSKF
jgi:hypothetical protein